MILRISHACLLSRYSRINGIRSVAQSYAASNFFGPFHSPFAHTFLDEVFFFINLSMIEVKSSSANGVKVNLN
jgi:hypothetical protein